MLRLRRRYGTVHTGPVVFSDGAHWPIRTKRNGAEAGPDLRFRLLWDADAAVYRYASPTDRTHLSLYHVNELEMVPGSEG